MTDVSAQLPVMLQPVTDQTMAITAPWYRFLLDLYNRTGQASGVPIRSYTIINPTGSSVALPSGYGTIIIDTSVSVTLAAPLKPLDGQLMTVTGQSGATFTASWLVGATANPFTMQYTAASNQWWRV